MINKNMDKLGDIVTVINLINSNSVENAYGFFDTHLDNIKTIGPFSSKTWDLEYRKKIYELGTQCKDPNIFSSINDILQRKIKENGPIEIYAFIHSEIIWNFFEQDNFYNKDILRSYIRLYPSNPEFHHTYSHFLEKNNDLEKSLFELKTAIKLENNSLFAITYLNKLYTVFNSMLIKNCDSADKFIKEEESYVKKNNIFDHLKMDFIILFSRLKDRVRDHKSIEFKIEIAKKDLENSIQIQQRKIIEVLGVFSAIVAFILTNINIALQNLTIREMLTLMFGMSLVLLIFVISISFLFGKRYRYTRRWSFFRNTKFWSIVVLMGILLSLIFLYI